MSARGKLSRTGAKAQAVAHIRHVGRRIVATNLLPGWDPTTTMRRAGFVVDVVTEGSAAGRRQILIFRTATIAAQVFAQMFNDGAYGLDPYLPSAHKFHSAKLSSLAG